MANSTNNVIRSQSRRSEGATTTAAPKTIEAICRAWRASEARENLECIEAGDNDNHCNAACDRAAERASKLFEKLQGMKPVLDDEISDLIHLAKMLLESPRDNSLRIKVILKMATNALHDRKIKQAA